MTAEVQLQPGADADRLATHFAMVLKALEIASNDFVATGTLIDDMRAKLWDYRDRLRAAGYTVQASDGRSWIVKPP